MIFRGFHYPFSSIPIFPSPLALSTQTRRVPGGYLNRWLIRAEVQVPCVIHDRINNRFYVHPSLMDSLKLLKRAGL